MKLVIISGRSGSGKSTGLHVLEDQGFFCIDNLPLVLLPDLAKELQKAYLDRVAVSIDARNIRQELSRFPEIINRIKQQQVDAEVIYLDADDEELLKRFSETRRKHPLSNHNCSLAEALKAEQQVLEPISNLADLTMDTTGLTLHDLRDIFNKRVACKQDKSIALLFESFGFKKGAPNDADYIFDVRCLPNPYWVNHLRQYTGKDQPIKEFLMAEPQVEVMFEDIYKFVEKWLPSFEACNRSYLTVAIGCTGGHHRSVYLAERLASSFQAKYRNVQVRHRELP
ncbi:RNase adapter RapZ [Zooshikella sp. RANM57]|uniref:RNase adapter RapZ n=1 Tax=Zooshikella sp. RANM57 TaxID=3425863 RepID=UPI003D6F6A4E